MDAFLDTSVLVATFYGEHEHHEPSIRVFLGQEKSTGCTAAHCLAECAVGRGQMTADAAVGRSKGG